MCGITGLVNITGKAVDETKFRQAVRSLAHRGPDGEGIHIYNHVGLGHRRLSIIDVQGGFQPLSNEDGSIWVTFNGEIYNYLELKDRLTGLGHRFKSQSDTEVIVHAYEQWGDKCVDFFRGMFAFGLYDTKQQTLFLARDRLGVKPLFYLYNQHQFIFASEIQAIKTLERELTINSRAMGMYLQLQYIPAPFTIYNNISKLNPGSSLILKIGQAPQIKKYWEVNFNSQNHRNEQEWIEEVDHLLYESTKIRLRSDVPFGAFLSGGVDSSLILSYISDILEHPVKSFSIGFEEKAFSELTYARQAADICHTHHYEEIVGTDALSIIPKLVRHFGEPFGDVSAVPTYFLSQLASSHVKMVLSGDGADESFGGYPRYNLISELTEPNWRGMKRRVRSFMGRIARRLGMLAPMPPMKTALDIWNVNMNALTHDDYLTLTTNSAISFGFREYDKYVVYPSNIKGNPQAQLHYLDMTNYLPGAILTKVDISSMHFGLEVRSPFLDHHIIELACNLPNNIKVGLAEDNQRQGKLIIKEVARRKFSWEFLTRPKMGFGVPLETWFKGPALNHIEEQLTSNKHLSHYITSEAIAKIIKHHRDYGGKAQLLWMILFMVEWLNYEMG